MQEKDLNLEEEGIVEAIRAINPTIVVSPEPIIEEPIFERATSIDSSLDESFFRSS
jgi:hypothetical protein